MTALAALVMATTAPLTMPRTESIRPPMMTIPMRGSLHWVQHFVAVRLVWSHRAVGYPVQFGTAGTLPTQLLGVLAVMGAEVVVMVPPWR
jgi:hypothetical protein